MILISSSSSGTIFEIQGGLNAFMKSFRYSSEQVSEMPTPMNDGGDIMVI